MSDLARHIRNVADFPKAGIGFKDITTLLKDGEAFQRSIDEITAKFDRDQIDKIVGIEARGFIFGAAIAHKWQLGFVPVRKAGKLPAETIREDLKRPLDFPAVASESDNLSSRARLENLEDALKKEIRTRVQNRQETDWDLCEMKTQGRYLSLIFKCTN